MSTAMYDAREAMIPGSVYDRSNTGEECKNDSFYKKHLLVHIIHGSRAAQWLPVCSCSTQ